MAARDAAGLLLASAIVIVAPVFALALWMPSFLFEDGATGAGVFHDVGAGDGVDAIFGVFVNNAVRGTDQAADASRAAANATTACAEISSSPPRPPTLHCYLLKIVELALQVDRASPNTVASWALT